MSRLRLAVLVLVAAPALLLAAPAEAHRGTPSLSAPEAVAALDVAAAPTLGVETPPAPARVASPAAGTPALAWVAAPRHLTLPWSLLAAAIAVAFVGAVRRPRTALALGLVLLVGVLAFESGVHSVHHLGDPGRASGCAVSATSLNLCGLAVEPVDLDRALAAIGPLLPGTAPSDVRALPESPHEGRAPPRLA